MKRMKYPTPALAGLWKKNFLNDTAKFAKSTHLEPEDFMTEFTDKDGEQWRILGAMAHKDMPCEKISTGDVFIWDRWEVSLLKHPNHHNRTSKTVEYSQDIKNDLKSDIRRLEGVVENVERDSKVAQRETDKSVQDARKDVRETKQEVDRITRQLEKDTAQQNKELQRVVDASTKELQKNVDSAVRQMQRENEAETKQLRKELDDKIKKALDNPLANK
jgi:hypothetical protein